MKNSKQKKRLMGSTRASKGARCPECGRRMKRGSTKCAFLSAIPPHLFPSDYIANAKAKVDAVAARAKSKAKRLEALRERQAWIKEECAAAEERVATE
jgi:hypothetical protein